MYIRTSSLEVLFHQSKGIASWCFHDHFRIIVILHITIDPITTKSAEDYREECTLNVPLVSLPAFSKAEEELIVIPWVHESQMV